MAHRWDPVAPRVTGLVRPVPRDETGKTGPTRGQAQGGGFRRTTRGLYVPSSVSDDQVEQRILEQSMRMSGTGAVTGWAALRLHGAAFFDGLEPDGRTRIPVPIAAGGDRLGSNSGVVTSRERLDGSEVVLRYGVRCTTVERALFDEMRRRDDLRQAVEAMDMAAAAELTSIRRMTADLSDRTGWRRLPLVDAALALAVEDSRAPTETRFRLIWELDAGWPRPVCNRPVYDLGGRLLGIPDLLDPDLGIVGEYDGADHRDLGRHTVDVRRESDFRRAGLEYVEVVGPDLRTPPLVVQRMESARARAGSAPRAWTIEPPDAARAMTLDERLDLRDLVRERNEDLD